jgi:hypothetical protein
MPKQIFDSKTFKSLIPRAEEVRVVRTGEKTKIKLRTKSMLYTYVSDDTEAEKLLKNVDKPIVDINPKEKKQKKEEEAEKQEKKEEKGKGKEKAKQEKEKGEEGEEAKEEKEASKQSPPPAKKERKRSASKSGKDEEKSEGE